MLNNKNFALYALGRLVSIIGSGIQGIAVLLFILDLTNSGTIVALFALFSTVPRLAMLPFAGVLGDRWNRKKIMIYTDFLNGLVVLFLAVLAYSKQITIPILMITQGLTSIFGIMFRSATRAMIPELVTFNELTKANSIIKGVENFSSIIGPVLGASLYSLWGIQMVFLINGLSFLLSGLSELFIDYHLKIEQGSRNQNSNFYTQIREGFKFISKSSSLKQLCVFYVISSLILLPLLSVFFPFLFNKVIGFSNQQFALLESAYVVGMLLGSIALATFFSKLSEKKLIRSGLITQGLMLIIFTILTYPSVVSFLNGSSWTLFFLLGGNIVVMGAVDIIYDTPIESNMQKLIPNHLRSRVLSVTQLVFGLGIPIGQFLYGFLLDRVQIQYILMTASAIYILAVLIFLSVATEEIYGFKAVPKKPDI